MHAAQSYLLICMFVIEITNAFAGENVCAPGWVSCGREGPCVPLEEQCDGIPNCLNQEDESFELCNSRPCSRESLSGDQFRCDYGACIDQLFVCNGIANCVDGSDETPQLCNGAVCRERIPFKCDYGACIHERKKCDGHRSCHHDGSDETIEACFNNECRSDKFRCNYGACIFKRKKCDGRLDCADGSDESEETCGSGHAVVEATTTNPTTILTTVVSSTGMSPTPVPMVFPSSNNNGCPVGYLDITGGCYLFSKPNALPRRSWRHAQSYCQSLSTEDYRVDLVVLKNFSTPQDDPVLNYMNTNGMWYTWFGAYYSPTSNMWSWLDGRELPRNSSIWSPGQPDDEGNSHCGVFGRNKLPYFSLFDNICSWKRDYACQIYDKETTSSTAMCPHKFCQCPKPRQHLCLPCSPDLNLTCAAIENDVECDLPSNFEENVELDILDCGILDYIIMKSWERNDMACNTSSSVPVLTRVVANCWKTKKFIAQCQHDGLWHSYGNEEIPLFSPSKSLCQQENINAPACGIHPRFEPDPLDFEGGGFILGSYLDQAPWPWLVGILRKNQYYCTGTLISPHFVLTAAHCVAQSQESPRPVDIRNVLIQRYNYSGFEYPDFPEQWISRIIIHPEFVPGSRPLHDIALVKLEEPIIFNKYTYPACVRSKNLEETLTGWTFNRTKGEGDYSWIEFEQQMDPSCQSSGNLNRADDCDRGLNVHQHQFCAINMEIDKWLYPGSSGGPFLVNRGDDINELWEISGIVSSSVNDNNCDVPYTIFTDVPAYADWIANCVNYDRCSLIH